MRWKRLPNLITDNKLFVDTTWYPATLYMASGAVSMIRTCRYMSSQPILNTRSSAAFIIWRRNPLLRTKVRNSNIRPQSRKREENYWLLTFGNLFWWRSSRWRPHRERYINGEPKFQPLQNCCRREGHRLRQGCVSIFDVSFHSNCKDVFFNKICYLPATISWAPWTSSLPTTHFVVHVLRSHRFHQKKAHLTCMPATRGPFSFKSQLTIAFSYCHSVI